MRRPVVRLLAAALAVVPSVVACVVAPTAASAATAPAPLLKPVVRITPATGCVALTRGVTGVKVKLVQRRLGFPAATWEEVDDATIRAVIRFQKARRLTPDGVVGPLTWRAMGFRTPFCAADRYQAHPALSLAATSAERIETMVAHARAQLGAEYVWGGAGALGVGYDCSGLVLQSLYRAGLDPQPITVVKHLRPDYRTSRELYAHPRMRHVPLARVRRGDLVFWRSTATGKINHVAIALGGGRTVEASGAKVHLDTVRNRPTQRLMPSVVRPFP